MASFRKCSHCQKSPEYLTNEIKRLKTIIEDKDKEITLLNSVIDRVLCEKQNLKYDKNVFDYDIVYQRNKLIREIKNDEQNK